ncbi:MAG: hypothetical protein K0R38_3681 [Polyangiaceae bacterium]|nr:hypothetical protein [Polyangiaceae bacterium]
MTTSLLAMLDELLRSPQSVAARVQRREDLRPLVLAALLSLMLGAGAFGAVLGAPRGGVQLGYAAAKLPLAMLGTLCLCAPAFTAIARALGRELDFAGMVGLSLSAAARASLVLLAFAPAVWFAVDRGLGYHGSVLLAVGCYGVAGLSALRVMASGLGKDARGVGVLLCCAAVLLPTGAQSAWMLRPFIGRPSQLSVPLLRHKESSFADAVYVSSRSSLGVYERVTANVERSE